MTERPQSLDFDFDIFGSSCTVEVMADTPEDVEGLRQALADARAEAAAARALASSTEAVIAALKLEDPEAAA